MRLCRLVDRLETWTSLSKEDKEKYIKEGVETCNRMLDGTYAGRSLSVRVTARLYALRANLHCHQGSYLLADADRAYSLCLDPFQHRVRLVAGCCAGPLTSASSPISALQCITTLSATAVFVCVCMDAAQMGVCFALHHHRTLS